MITMLFILGLLDCALTDTNNEVSAKTNCSITDFLHFKRIKLWSDSTVTSNAFRVNYKNTEVHYSLCVPLPPSVLDFCKIGHDRSQYFYVEIQGQTCEAIKFTDIKRFEYSKLNLENEKNEKSDSPLTRQVNFKFTSFKRQVILSYPSTSYVQATQIQDQTDTLLLAAPSGYINPKLGKDFITEGGYYWSNEFDSFWFLYMITRLICVSTLLMFFKIGQKFYGVVRPFDLMINFYLSVFVIDNIFQAFSIFRQDYTSVVILLIPFVIASIIDMKIPSLTQRITVCKNPIFIFLDLWLPLVFLEATLYIFYFGMVECVVFLLIMIGYVVIGAIWPKQLMSYGYFEYLLNIGISALVVVDILSITYPVTFWGTIIEVSTLSFQSKVKNKNLEIKKLEFLSLELPISASSCDPFTIPDDCSNLYSVKERD